MTEERYRTYKLILLTVFVGGALIIGWKLSEGVKQVAENGRYVQLDRQKDFHDLGGSSSGFPTQVIDTRTGAVQPAGVVRP